ncbi:16S rRNA (cytidine(1402)-2'-O)-methyltransferase [Leptothrix discophora]|uniref:Ribosomal RNA small subunit methyltransferase I n=1 Tax=Leptothrix discophora TaxID=89 RepID=A0ABT9G515_LEPDI|nr:16S rRNA (cytidine(1402)-2'-O)-methyltransferase [Leptothrix discophora]MDP4301585.1 16S rRNA (cytidine(1402)-2'-O)-methyltransferase [Leptothrix discophora]
MRQAAAAATGGQQLPAGALYVVATPIGNLADITLRAVHVLGLVDALACEDTRVSGGLMQRLGLHKPLLSLHEHNEERVAAQVVARLQAGERIAYVSDAGTPAVSDPGARLVAAVRAAGLRVLPLPGASSVVTALSAAGDVAAEGFRFLGFLPAKAQARRQALLALRDDATARLHSQVLFEAPHRIEALAEALAEVLPERCLTVCRELTKQFESLHTLAAADLPAWLAADADRRRGEFVLVLHALGQPARRATADDEPAEVDPALAAIEPWLRALLPMLPLKQLAALASGISGLPRNALYTRLLALKAELEADEDDEGEDSGFGD